jgi:hypothetical protein
MPDFPITRCVYHLAGFDPVTPEATLRRFEREIRRFEATWSTRAEVGPIAVSEETATWTTTVTGPGWQTTSEHHLLRWDDVIIGARERSNWTRVPLGAVSLFSFIRHGALWRYLRRSHRYAFFFLYPVLVLLAMAVVAALVGFYAAWATGWSLVGLATAPLAFIGLTILANRQLALDHLLDDWIFARDYVYDDHTVLGPRLERAAAAILARRAAEPKTEIVVLGHSLGAVLAIDLIDRVLAASTAHAAPIKLVTVGSSILKLGFHAGSERLRAALERVAASTRVFWVEYQALNDVMNFYKRDPLRELRLEGRGPVIRTIRFNRMLDPAAYARIRRNLFRLHCQFISGNTLRAPYDYFMLLCGPFQVEDIVDAPEGAVNWLRDNGALADPARIFGADDASPATALAKGTTK